MNSFINAMLQKKLRKFAENPISGPDVPRLMSQVSGPMSWIPGFGSWVSCLRSRVTDPTNSPKSQVPFLGYAKHK